MKKQIPELAEKPKRDPRPRTKRGFVLCDNCDNFASKQLYEAVGWNACGACCFGEAAALAEYTDYYKPGEAVYVEKDPRVDCPLPAGLMITVCDACLMACCWQGKLFCDNSHSASTVEMPVKTLRKMQKESSDYWEADPRAINWRCRSHA